jgi:hypothetical protein
MTSKKTSGASTAAGEPINPDFVYPIASDVVGCVIGLSRNMIDHAVAAGDLPQPVTLLPNGRRKGFTGRQLLEIQRAREAAAAERERARARARGGAAA